MFILTQLFFIGFGLSMDAFAVAICKGLSMKKIRITDTLIIAAVFGAFQAVMPWIGWMLGNQFSVYMKSIDHWIAFFLLLLIGGKMIFEAVRRDPNEACKVVRINVKELFVLGVATSIDALAVGLTFAFLEIPILQAMLVIGVTTFVISILGVYIGNHFGNRFEKRAEIAGGGILILIGLKILLEHTGFLSMIFT
ncbi:MAG: manganese efflux pump MntP family protein [Lachnospiraceae bacterium]